jgi:DNA (cytosine-5)-methyltransferase 1
VNEKTHLDLFSGIGGFALAAKWNGYKTIGFCEQDKFCQAILKKHWPEVPIIEDIRQVRGNLYPKISLLTGGFPCQPFSVAGERRGKDDNRYLWPEMLRVIRETKPDWIIGENVAGIVNMALDQVHVDLEAEDYEVETLIIPACAVDASHRRDRCWIVAHSKLNGQSSGAERRSIEEAVRIQSQGSLDTLNPSGASVLSTSEHDVENSKREQLEERVNIGGEGGTHAESTGSDKSVSGSLADTISLPQGGAHGSQERECIGGRQDSDISQRDEVGRNSADSSQDLADSIKQGREGRVQGWEDSQREDIEGYPGRCGTTYGQSGEAIWIVEPCMGRVANGVPNRVARLKSLGNAIVPQVAQEIIRCINEVEKTIR